MLGHWGNWGNWGARYFRRYFQTITNVDYRRSGSPETGYRINGGIGKKSSDENVKKIELDSRF